MTLYNEYRNNPSCSKQMKMVKKDTKISLFYHSWKNFKNLYPNLFEFSGGLATLYCGSSSVESDFSGINFIKDDYSSWLSNFSLAGQMNSKQYSLLKKLTGSDM